MRTLLLILILTLPGCWQSNSDNDNVTTVWAVQNTGGVNASGGGIVQVTGLTVPAFVFDEAVPFAEELPEPDREAVAEAEALALPEGTVIDALYTADGLLALVRETEGMSLTILNASPMVRVAAPEDALRLLPAGENPLRVLVVLADGQAVVATRAEPD